MSFIQRSIEDTFGFVTSLEEEGISLFSKNIFLQTQDLLNLYINDFGNINNDNFIFQNNFHDTFLGHLLIKKDIKIVYKGFRYFLPL